MIARFLHTFGKSREGRKWTAFYAALRRGRHVGAGSALGALNGFSPGWVTLTSVGAPDDVELSCERWDIAL